MGKKEPLTIRIFPEDHIAAQRRLNSILMDALSKALTEAEAYRRELTASIEMPGGTTPVVKAEGDERG